MLDFQQYQQQFTAHLRDPTTNKQPKKVNNARMAVYRELVFSNFLSAVSPCFPVCISILGKRKWQQLVRQFMITYQVTTPIFREIPAQFLAFLNTQTLPDYLKQLAHYEWAELEVAGSSASFTSVTNIDFAQKIQLNPTAMLLHYDYPVHQLRRKNTHLTGDTYLLVFKKTNGEIHFVALNGMTFVLLTELQLKPCKADALLTQFAKTIQQPKTAINTFGLQLLHDLAAQQAIISAT